MLMNGWQITGVEIAGGHWEQGTGGISTPRARQTVQGTEAKDTGRWAMLLSGSEEHGLVGTL